jgi:hypothetical protein
MKSLFIFTLLFSFSGFAGAAEEITPTPAATPAARPTPSPEAPVVFLPTISSSTARSDLYVGFSFLRWNENLRLQQGPALGSDTANFTGFNANLEKNFIYPTWGYGLGVNIGTGKATGGGNSVIPFHKTNQAWSSYGALVRAYQRLSPRISVGVVAPLVFRKIDWQSETPGIDVTSGQNINMGLLLELTGRIANNLDFYQQIGPFSSTGTTMWRLGLNYRIR